MADKKKSASQSQMAEPKTRTSDKEQPVKSAKSAVREVRKEQPKQESKSTRRDSKSSPTLVKRFRNSRIGRFILDAYYELRHKVTWPTFTEARNMTIAVIAISIVIAVILGLADLGLSRLYLLIIGGGR
jgi:preprotein translocase subunit SecE